MSHPLGWIQKLQKLVRDLILRLAREKGNTVFLNSHDLDEVQRVCSTFAILQRGELKAYDTIANLRKKFWYACCWNRSHQWRRDGEGSRSLTFADYVSSVKRNGLKITISIGDGKASTLLGTLMKNDVEVEEIKTTPNSLEEIYLTIVRQSEGTVTLWIWHSLWHKRKSGILSEQRIALGGLLHWGDFGVLNVFLSGQVLAINNTVFSVSSVCRCVCWVLVFWIYISAREARDNHRNVALHPAQFEVNMVWKSVGATIPAYLFSLLTVSLVIIVSNIIVDTLLFPSIAILIHVLGVVPVFIASAVSLIGFCQFFAGDARKQNHRLLSHFWYCYPLCIRLFLAVSFWETWTLRSPGLKLEFYCLSHFFCWP